MNLNVGWRHRDKLPSDYFFDCDILDKPCSPNDAGMIPFKNHLGTTILPEYEHSYFPISLPVS